MTILVDERARGLSQDTPDAGGRLRMSKPNLEELTDLETPAYLFDANVVVRRYQALRRALGTQLIVSFKCNSLVDLLSRTCAAFVDGIELASIGELTGVIGRVSATKYVNNPAMPDAFMQAAAMSACVFIVDSVSQAERLASLGPGRSPHRAVLRVNARSLLGPDARAVSQDHFGLDEGDLERAGRLLLDAGWDVCGLHVFAGSNMFAKCGPALVRAMAARAPQLERALGVRLPFINLGGGFPENWEDAPEDMAAYRAELDAFPKGYQLAHESGRGIYGRAGIFVTRVVGTKLLNGQRFVVCDGGIAQNFLLASTESLVPRPTKAHLVGRRPVDDGAELTLAPVQVVGSSCSRQDVIGVLPAGGSMPSSGDFCVFENCGAYNSTYTVANFLSLPSATPYLRAVGSGAENL